MLDMPYSSQWWQPPKPDSRMLEGWRERVERARRIIEQDDRAIELEGVTFAPEEVADFLLRFEHGEI
jgi:hypothetical protein